MSGCHTRIPWQRCRLYGCKITKISSFCFSFVCFFRPYLLDGGLSLLAVDVDGYPAGTALCNITIVYVSPKKRKLIIYLDKIALTMCLKAHVPREFLRYSSLYTYVTIFAGLVFNDSIYQDSTELKLKRVEVYALGFQDPKDTLTVGNLIVMLDYLGEPPCGWNNSKRNRFLKKSSEQLSQIFQKGNFTLFFEKQQSTPFFINSICITLIERL